MQEGFTTDGIIRRDVHKNALRASRKISKIIKHRLRRSAHPANRIRARRHDGSRVDRWKKMTTVLPVESPSPNLTLPWLLFSSLGGEICFSGVGLFVRGMIASLSAREAIRHVRAIARQSHVVFARVKYFPITFKIPLSTLLCVEGRSITSRVLCVRHLGRDTFELELLFHGDLICSYWTNTLYRGQDSLTGA